MSRVSMDVASRWKSRSNGAGESSNVVLRMGVATAQPRLATSFLQTGGSLNLANAEGEVDLHLTGGLNAVFVTGDSSVDVHLPASEVEQRGNTVYIKDTMRVGVAYSRKAVSINGLLIQTTPAGRASTSLAAVLQASLNGIPHTVQPRYGSVEQPACSVSFSNAALVDGKGSVFNVHVVQTESGTDAETNAITKVYNDGMKSRAERLLYKPLPGLVKDLSQISMDEPMPYSMTSVNASLEPPFSMQTTDALMHASLRALMPRDEDFAGFLTDTSVPSLAASKHATTVASALSCVAGMTIGYRSDGVVMPGEGGKPINVSTESWSSVPMRTLVAGDDCETSASAVQSLGRAVQLSTAEDLEGVGTGVLRNVKNALCFHEMCLGIVGATTAHAAGDAKGKHASVGHCAAFVVPKLHLGLKTKEAFLRSGNTQAASAGDAVMDSCIQSILRAAGTLDPRDEAALRMVHTLSSLGQPLDVSVGAITSPETRDRVQQLLTMETCGLEGTSPTLSRLYESDASLRNRIGALSETQTTLHTELGPTVFSRVKALHVDASGSDHRFYRDVIQLIPPVDTFLINARVKSAGLATHSLTLVGKSGFSGKSGATVRELAVGDFDVDLSYALTWEEAQTLDALSKSQLQNVVAPRTSQAIQLTEEQTRHQNKSLEALRQFKARLETQSPQGGTALLYLMPVGALALNGDALVQSLNALASKCKGGSVEVFDIPGAVRDHTGRDVGKVASLHVVM